ncbi:MAG TPA: hypothetical protein VEF53_14625 [Patescibacteria group bacterium]|nr:hypothetical protein [Patescibacteria group bacterium]
MSDICYYSGTVPMTNSMCNNCSLFLDVCRVVASPNGYDRGSELDCWLCTGCDRQCSHKGLVNH